MEINTKNKKILVEKFKAYHNKAMKLAGDTGLSPNQIYAISQYVLDDIMKQAFDRVEFTEEDRDFIKAEFKKLLQEECPGMIFTTPLVFRPNIGFFKKEED